MLERWGAAPPLTALAGTVKSMVTIATVKSGAAARLMLTTSLAVMCSERASIPSASWYHTCDSKTKT